MSPLLALVPLVAAIALWIAYQIGRVQGARDLRERLEAQQAEADHYDELNRNYERDVMPDTRVDYERYR